jgi:hypothetical protein
MIGTAIAGVVFDSLAMRGLAGATVQISSAGAQSWSRSANSDSAGAFEFGDVPTGTYLIGFFHPKLDSLAIATPTLRVDVRTEQPMRVRLGVPSARTIARSLCGSAAIGDSTGLLMGYLRGADNSMPRLNGTVTVRWTEIIIEKNSIQRHVPTTDASSGSTGLFAVCGVPVGAQVLLKASSASDSSGSFEVMIPESGFLHRDVFVAPVTRTRVSAGDSAPPAELLRGTARLRGQIVGTTGRPIPSARVMVWGTGLETTTDSEGGFTITALPGGTHTLEVRAIGFSPTQRPVDILLDSQGATEVELTKLGITLDTVRVSAQRLYASQRQTAMERRVRSNLGHLIDQDEIVKRKPFVLTDLLRRVPGVRVVWGDWSEDALLYVRGHGVGGGHALCRPEIFVDGGRLGNDGTFPINSLTFVDELRAVEVYRGRETIPPDFRSLNNGCGVIAIWTGPRRKIAH